MSQGGSDAAVVTADTSQPKPQRSVKNEICIIIGDMVKDGHNMEVVNAFLAHGYNMVILYSNEDKTDEKDIGALIDKKFGHQIVDISKIDVKSSDAINQVFTHLASKLTSEEWSQCQVTVLIYNAALGLVKLVGSKDDEKKDSDNNKNDLTLKELAYCHDIAAHGFIHCVKEGLKFFDSKSESNFHIFYGKPECDKNSELMKIVNYGTSLISDNIKNDNKKLLHVISKPASGMTYLSVISNETSYDEWATIKLDCKISTEINETPYYIVSTTGNNAIELKQGITTFDWQLGVNESNKLYSRAYSIATPDQDEKMCALGISAGNIYANSTCVGEYQKWKLEPMVTKTEDKESIFTKFRIVNQGRSQALKYDTDKTSNTYTLASTDTIKKSAALWSFEFKSGTKTMNIQYS